MEMTPQQKHAVLLEELGELLQNKNTTITVLRWQLEELEAKLAAAENELKTARAELYKLRTPTKEGGAA